MRKHKQKKSKNVDVIDEEDERLKELIEMLIRFREVRGIIFDDEIKPNGDNDFCKKIRKEYQDTDCGVLCEMRFQSHLAVCELSNILQGMGMKP